LLTLNFNYFLTNIHNRQPSKTPSRAPSGSPSGSPITQLTQCLRSVLVDLATESSPQFQFNDRGVFEYSVSFSNEPLSGLFVQLSLQGFGTWNVGRLNRVVENEAIFNGGTFCGAIGSGRSGKIIFQENCSAGALSVLSVTEPSTCYYVMTVDGLCCPALG